MPPAHIWGHYVFDLSVFLCIHEGMPICVPGLRHSLTGLPSTSSTLFLLHCILGLLAYEKKTLPCYNDRVLTGSPTDDLDFEDVLNP